MTFREKVLHRKNTERSNRRHKLVSITLSALMLIAYAYGAYEHHRQRMLVDAPSWASFTMAGPSLEFVEQGADGVPRSLVINGEQWSVVQVHDFKSKMTAANTDCAHHTIAYLPVTHRQLLKVNIMHEVFHAGACLHGGDTWWNSEHPNSTDHPGIYHLGDFTATFLHDNAEFAAWMAQ